MNFAELILRTQVKVQKKCTTEVQVVKLREISTILEMPEQSKIKEFDAGNAKHKRRHIFLVTNEQI